jgi:hypothetical protein
MHATTEQLLGLRDGEPVPEAVHDHVEGCDRCRRELMRLARLRDELRRLPAIEPDRSLWEAVAVGSLEERPVPRFSWASAAGIAASFVVALVVLARIGPGSEPAATPSTAASAPSREAVGEVVPSGSVATVADLQLRSRRLENLRRAMPERPRVVRASTASTIADLQDQIALVDLRLNAADELALTPAQREALWRERVNLMQTLVRLEYARLQTPRY